jgi:hypothetical protein
MKIKIRFALILALGLYASVNLMAQKPSDLVGTWVGMATVEGIEPNELTLLLEMKEGKLTGHMTGQYGMMREDPISEIKLEEEVFSFHVATVGPSGQDVTLIFKMKVDSDSMKGDLEIPELDMKGIWEAKKQK